MQLLELRSVALFGWRTPAACATAICGLTTETAETAKGAETAKTAETAETAKDAEAAGTAQARAGATAKQLLETVSIYSLMQRSHRVFRR